MYNGQSEYVPNKKQTKRSLNDHRKRMPYSFRSCSLLFTIQVEGTSTDTYRIPTGCQTHENRTYHTRTGQTAYQRTSYVHPPYIFTKWHPFKVLNMAKTCQRIGPDKRISPDTEPIHHMRNGQEMHTNGQIILLSIRRSLALSSKV